MPGASRAELVALFRVAARRKVTKISGVNLELVDAYKAQRAEAIGKFLEAYPALVEAAQKGSLCNFQLEFSIKMPTFGLPDQSLNEVIGYFELASTRGKKLPTRESIRWLELIATLLGMMISKR